jgi:glycogen debranching enzyme
MKPKTWYITDKYGHEGIDITYTKSRKTISIGGWFDSIVGIENQEFSLKDFIELSGIPKKDLAEVIK